MLPHPLDSGLVTQTHDAKHAKKDSFIQPSPAQKTAKNIKLKSQLQIKKHLLPICYIWAS